MKPWPATATLTLLVALCCVALCTSVLSAGVVFEATTTLIEGDSNRTETISISAAATNLRVATLNDHGGIRDEFVFRGDRREMVTINHHDRSYMLIEGDALTAMTGDIQGQIEEAMSEVKKELEGLDPKQREMIEKMLGAQMGAGGMAEAIMPERPKTEYRKTDERAEHSGYPCTRWEVTREGQLVRELWVTDWDNIEGSEIVRKGFFEMASLFEEMMDSFPGKWVEDMANSPVETFAHVKGFPVVTRTFENGSLENETVLGSVTERDIGPDMFEPPKGYRMRTMGTMGPQ